MDMKDLEGRIIKISAHTITIKDEAGKTRGMVRNVTPWNHLQFNRQVEFSMNVRRQGLKLPNDKTRIIMSDNRMYYLKNDHARIFWGDNPPEIALESIEREEREAQTAQAAGLDVITVSKIIA